MSDIRTVVSLYVYVLSYIGTVCTVRLLPCKICLFFVDSFSTCQHKNLIVHMLWLSVTASSVGGVSQSSSSADGRWTAGPWRSLLDSERPHGCPPARRPQDVHNWRTFPVSDVTVCRSASQFCRSEWRHRTEASSSHTVWYQSCHWQPSVCHLVWQASDRPACQTCNPSTYIQTLWLNSQQ